MTERDWLTSKDPQAMLAFLRDCGHASGRKLRLFAVACCRSVRHPLAEERFRKAVEVAEGYADGQASLEDLEAAVEPLWCSPRPNKRSAAALYAAWGPWFRSTSLSVAVGI